MTDREIPYEEPYHVKPSDLYLWEAKGALVELFTGDRSAVYYGRQLQVRLEGRIFHWITSRALIELEEQGVIKKITKQVRMSDTLMPLHLYTHPSNRYPQRAANFLTRIVEEYSSVPVTEGCGNRAEVLFAAALASRGFTHHGPGINKFQGIQWTQTSHNLDYIFERDGITYGCEIKNKLQYIEKKELELKVSICKHLDVIPFFILRHAPKTSINYVQKAGGFVLIFEAQIYELGQRALVEKLREILGERKADCPRAIPSGIIDRFEKWHLWLL
jgi:hypothetical protein